jgi:hypothetical protein
VRGIYISPYYIDPFSSIVWLTRYLDYSLAWCELLVLLANLFRRFELTPVGVGPGDMEWADLVLTVYVDVWLLI